MKTNKPLTPDELATALGAPRSWESRPAPANYDWPAHVRRVSDDLSAQRDRARSNCTYLWGACVVLFLALLYVGMNPPKRAPVNECPSPGVMQLDPTTIRARALESVEL